MHTVCGFSCFCFSPVTNDPFEGSATEKLPASTMDYWQTNNLEALVGLVEKGSYNSTSAVSHRAFQEYPGHPESGPPLPGRS
jgi:hypothetical protein